MMIVAGFLLSLPFLDL